MTNPPNCIAHELRLPKPPWALVLLLAIGLGCENDPGAPPPSAKSPTAKTPTVAEPSNPSSADGEATDVVQEWHTLHAGESRIGYGHFRSEAIERNGRPLQKTLNVSELTFDRFGQKLTMQMEVEAIETPDGDLIEMTSVLRNPPALPTKTSARIEGTTLHVELEINGKMTKRTLDAPEALKSPNWVHRASWVKPMKPGETRRFEGFVPELGLVARTTMKAVEHETIAVADGSREDLLRIDVDVQNVPGTISTFVDEDGHERVARMQLPGMTIVGYAVTRDVALRESKGGKIDLAVSTLIRVERITEPYGAKRIVYRVRAEDDDPAKFFTEDDRQTIRRINDTTIELVVEPAVKTIAATKTVDAEFLEPSSFVQSDDADVVKHARAATADATEPLAVAKRMERYVRRAITSKNFSTAMASAAEVADRLEGDCTEHAVLLAAMLRAKRIPSRIVVGYVYVPTQTAFAGHMWTEAYVDGRWHALDATLGRGRIGAVHLAMAKSSFGEDGANPITAFLPVLQGLGKLSIDVLDVQYD